MTGVEEAALLAAIGGGSEAALGSALGAEMLGAGAAGLGGGTAALFAPEAGFAASMLGASGAPLAGMAPMFTGAAGPLGMTGMASFGAAGLPASAAIGEAALAPNAIPSWLRSGIGSAGKMANAMGKSGLLGGDEKMPNVPPAQRPQQPQVQSMGEILKNHGLGQGVGPQQMTASNLAIQARMMGLSPEEFMSKLMRGGM